MDIYETTEGGKSDQDTVQFKSAVGSDVIAWDRAQRWR
jgi:hypothetical protein